jgi:hypothetical protein
VFGLSALVMLLSIVVAFRVRPSTQAVADVDRMR